MTGTYNLSEGSSTVFRMFCVPVRMKPSLDIRVPLKNGVKAALSHPIFLLFGACIAAPKVLSQFFLGKNLEESGSIESLRASMSSVLPFDVALFLFSVLATFLIGSFGIVALILLMNRQENNERIPVSSIGKLVLARIPPVVRLEFLLIAFAVIIGILVMAPGDIALARGLQGLSRALSLSAFGLMLSISLLFFFLRQYAILYLSLSKISLKDALENAARLFRLYIKETFLLSAFLLFVELFSLFLLALLFSFIESLVKLPSPFSLGGMIFEWALMIGMLSFLEAWNWASWTSFFRMIALPKEPEPVLQKSETVLQQESVIGLDKA